MLLAHLKTSPIAPEEAASLGDTPLTPSTTPMLSRSSLERRFGYRFATALESIEEGVWSGPIESRHGVHLVFIHERVPAQTKTLEEARRAVRIAVREDRAEAGLRRRVRQLRDRYAVVLPLAPGTP